MPAKLVTTENQIDSIKAKREFEKTLRPFIEMSLSMRLAELTGEWSKNSFVFKNQLNRLKSSLLT